VRALCDLVVVGASLGGLEALTTLLGGLPATMPPIAVVQHRLAEDEDSTRLVELLGAHTPLRVIEPDDKTPLDAGTVYVAPSDYHLQIEKGWFSLSTDAPVQFARPSIDVLFETAAEVYGRRVVAVVLTCASIDGVAGAMAVKRHGGRVLVQDPQTARSPVLPQAVVDTGVAQVVAPLADLPRHILAACGVG
jgi:two-component system, chemotaxis family, protein-glutamate methylesterase/glutaminase